MQFSPRRELSFLLLLAASAALHAQPIQATPLAPRHPLIGVWRLDIPGSPCRESYDIRPDGTMNVTSGSQAASTVFEMSPEPSPKGFYRWTDRIVKDNGQPDCMGSIMQVGHEATNYILLDPSKRQFMLCAQEALNRCVGPFRKEGSDV